MTPVLCTLNTKIWIKTGKAFLKKSADLVAYGEKPINTLGKWIVNKY